MAQTDDTTRTSRGGEVAAPGYFGLATLVADFYRGLLGQPAEAGGPHRG